MNGMRWSWRVGRFFGIDVFVHFTFVLLIALLAGWKLLDSSPADVLVQVFVLLALFGCVLLHEFGHAFAARAFGIHTRDITLLPIGGLARLERMPREPGQEFLIAIAGPAVNVVIALLLSIVILAVGGTFSDFVPPSGHTLMGVLVSLWWMNLLLAGFNLLPAYPMDGGRVLRALLAAVMDFGRATRIALRIGQVMAIGLALVGFYFNLPGLLLVALLVFLGGTQEASAVATRQLLDGMTVKSAMTTRFEPLATYQSLEEAAAALLRTSQHDFPVLGDDGRFLGMLGEGDLVRELHRRGTTARVVDAARRTVESVSPADSLPDVYEKMASQRSAAVPVMQEGQLIGLLSADGIHKLLRLRQALAATGANGVGAA